MKTFLSFLFLVFVISCHAQDQTMKTLQSGATKTFSKDANDTVQKIWKAGGLYSLNIAQGSLSNWAAGGDNFSLTVNSLLSLYAFYKKDKHSWDNSFDFNLGYINTTSLGSRKNDDRFDLFSKYGYALSKKINLAGLFDLRSQFFKGYSYSGDTKTLSSDFFAPGYILLGAGFDYKPDSHLSIFFSPLTARWVIVRDTALSNQGAYGVTPGKKSNLELGAFATINYLKDFSKSVSFKSRLDLFSNYRHNPQNIDIYMTNALNIKLSKILTASWGVDFIYDDDVKLFGSNHHAPGLQVKSLVGLGLLIKYKSY
jgi:hypothetical protein